MQADNSNTDIELQTLINELKDASVRMNRPLRQMLLRVNCKSVNFDVDKNQLNSLEYCERLRDQLRDPGQNTGHMHPDYMFMFMFGLSCFSGGAASTAGCLLTSKFGHGIYWLLGCCSSWCALPAGASRIRKAIIKDLSYMCSLLDRLIQLHRSQGNYYHRLSFVRAVSINNSTESFTNNQLFDRQVLPEIFAFAGYDRPTTTAASSGEDDNPNVPLLSYAYT